RIGGHAEPEPGEGRSCRRLPRARRVDAHQLAELEEVGELMCIDALHRSESCGCHFRSESQTEDGEALRDDENFAYVAAWEFQENEDGTGPGMPILHKEDLTFEAIELKQRSRSEEHTSELQSRFELVCRLLLEKKKSIRKTLFIHKRYIMCSDIRLNFSIHLKNGSKQSLRNYISLARGGW